MAVRNYKSYEERVAETEELFEIQRNSTSYNSKLSNFLAEPTTQDFTRNLVEKAFTKIFIKDQIFASPELLCQELKDYFELCDRTHIIPTISSLSCCLGVTHPYLYTKAKSEGAIGEILSQAIGVVHSFQETGALTGNINSNLYTFLSKNYFGLKDNTSLTIAPIQTQTLDTQGTMRVLQEQLTTEEQENSEN